MPRSADHIERHDLLRRRLEKFTRMLQGVEVGDIDAVHRTRVASRRLREVLPVLQLDHELVSKLSRRLRKVTKRLGSVREFDVLPAVLDELRAIERYPQGALNRVAAHIGEDRASARARLLGRVQMGELRRVATKLDKVTRTLEKSFDRRLAERHSWRWAIDARIARRRSTLAAAIAEAGAVYMPARLHAVRIAVKKLRYALELAAEADNVKSTPDLAELRRAQDVLGRLHDLQMLGDRARDIQVSMTPPDLEQWREIDTFLAALEEDCRRLHARYVLEAAALTALCSRVTDRSQKLEGRRQKLKSFVR
jgi:CHAD domain-containing protein